MGDSMPPGISVVVNGWRVAGDTDVDADPGDTVSVNGECLVLAERTCSLRGCVMTKLLAMRQQALG